MPTRTSALLRSVHLPRATRPLLWGTAWLFALGACATSNPTPVFDLPDPAGDVRLHHPPSALVGPGTFDLERFSLARDGDRVIVEVTFGAPLRTERAARVAEDLTRDLLPQTVDVYLDTVPGEGQLRALPGRGFTVPASEAWDWVLVVSSLDDLDEANVIRPLHVVTRGRTLRATFDGRRVPREIAGVLPVVLATSTSGEGRVRPVQLAGGDCHVWQDERCFLEGKGPPVLDTVGEVTGGRVIALHYRDGERPRPSTLPIVFKQGEVLTVSPTPEGLLAVGALVTVVDAAGAPLGTASVMSVVGEVSSLRWVGGEVPEAASAIIPSAGPVTPPAAPKSGDQE